MCGEHLFTHASSHVWGGVCYQVWSHVSRLSLVRWHHTCGSRRCQMARHTLWLHIVNRFYVPLVKRVTLYRSTVHPRTFWIVWSSQSCVAYKCFVRKCSKMQVVNRQCEWGSCNNRHDKVLFTLTVLGLLSIVRSSPLASTPTPHSCASRLCFSCASRVCAPFCPLVHAIYPICVFVRF